MANKLTIGSSQAAAVFGLNLHGRELAFPGKCKTELHYQIRCLCECPILLNVVEIQTSINKSFLELKLAFEIPLASDSTWMAIITYIVVCTESWIMNETNVATDKLKV